jgi:hypothetical protein
VNHNPAARALPRIVICDLNADKRLSRWAVAYDTDHAAGMVDVQRFTRFDLAPAGDRESVESFRVLACLDVPDAIREKLAPYLDAPVAHAPVSSRSITDDCDALLAHVERTLGSAA